MCDVICVPFKMCIQGGECGVGIGSLDPFEDAPMFGVTAFFLDGRTIALQFEIAIGAHQEFL